MIRRLLGFAVLCVTRPLIGALVVWDDLAMDLSEDL
jgi:hypothetical protein